MELRTTELPDLIITRLLRQREMTAGPAMDALVTRKVFGGEEVKAYSTEPDHVADVSIEIGRWGYEIILQDEADAITCLLLRDSKQVVKVSAATFEEAICRAALKLFGSDPA